MEGRTVTRVPGTGAAADAGRRAGEPVDRPALAAQWRAETWFTRPGSSSASGASTEVRVAIAGPAALLDVMAPDTEIHGMRWERIAIDPWEDGERLAAKIEAVSSEVTVILDPPALPDLAPDALRGLTLGILTEGLAGAEHAGLLEGLDRVVTFDPALTGERLGAGTGRVWRAIPPPVSDSLYAPVRAGHGRPRCMALGRATPHRDTLLVDAKHEHDLLELVQGVGGPLLRELLHAHDVGIFFAREAGAAFGQQIGMHLAAGHLLIAGPLGPAHGLERDIDYLQVDSGRAVAQLLDRIGRFPEMFRSVRVRGRLKAEQYRASRIFPRVVHDLLADAAAFGA
ncbi:MAG: hypothetical protein KGJ43_04945 [Acidobacteriota bacterium]|nr:hypothetical protein [Acidobacteriota bacterium]